MQLRKVFSTAYAHSSLGTWLSSICSTRKVITGPMTRCPQFKSYRFYGVARKLLDVDSRPSGEPSDRSRS